MKKITLCAAALALSVGLFAGCSSSKEEAPSNEETPSGEQATAVDNLIFDSIVVDEALQAEFEEMCDRNLLENVLDTYAVVGYTATAQSYMNGEKAMAYVMRESFSNAGSGIMYWSETEYNEDGVLGYATYNDGINPRTLAASSMNGGYTCLEVYPGDEFMAMVRDRWVACDSSYEERAVSITVDEGAGNRIYVTRGVDEFFGNEFEIAYVVDNETGLVKEIKVVEYSLETGMMVGDIGVAVVYNEPFEFVSDPVADVFGGEDLCKVTVIFNPGQDSEEVQTFSVVEGTYVYVLVDDEYLTLYGDVACTEELEGLVASGDEATVYVKYIG